MFMLLLSLLLTPALAQDSRTPSAAPAAQERADYDHHTFAEIQQGAESSTTLTVENPTRRAVAITAPTVPAGLRVILPEGTVAPGGSATVTVILTGELSVDGDLILATGPQQRVIRIKGNVLPKPTSGAPVDTSGAPPRI